MTEEWKIVPYTRNAYSVSDLGRVRSEARLIRTRHGVLRKIPQLILTPSPTAGGYPQVPLSVEGYVRREYVHDLVLLSFVGRKPRGLEVLHANDVKADNRLINLRYGTRSENARDAVRNGRNHLARRTRCASDHEFTPDNVYRSPSKPTVRVCRACKRTRREARKLVAV